VITHEELISRIVEARSLAMIAKHLEEQTVRDAYRNGVTVSELARVLGTQSRERIYRIIGSGKK